MLKFLGRVADRVGAVVDHLLMDVLRARGLGDVGREKLDDVSQRPD
ncbi:MAG: hypothetical protein JOZ39_08675 [Chloroflexi bacterium]|nr:hypothetical protein [Chloroflexota bacterium]